MAAKLAALQAILDKKKLDKEREAAEARGEVWVPPEVQKEQKDAKDAPADAGDEEAEEEEEPPDSPTKDELTKVADMLSALRSYKEGEELDGEDLAINIFEPEPYYDDGYDAPFNQGKWDDAALPCGFPEMQTPLSESSPLASVMDSASTGPGSLLIAESGNGSAAQSPSGRARARKIPIGRTSSEEDAPAQADAASGNGSAAQSPSGRARARKIPIGRTSSEEDAPAQADADSALPDKSPTSKSPASPVKSKPLARSSSAEEEPGAAGDGDGMPPSDAPAGRSPPTAGLSSGVMARASSLEKEEDAEAAANSARQLSSQVSEPHSLLSSLAPSALASPRRDGEGQSPTGEREPDAFARRPSNEKSADKDTGAAAENARSRRAELAQLDDIVKAAELAADPVHGAGVPPVRLVLETSSDKEVLQMPDLMRVLTMEDSLLVQGCLASLRCGSCKKSML